jgi:hypothetical protein
VSELISAVDELTAEDLHELSDVQLGDDVLALFVVAARIDGEIARRLVAFDRRGGAAADGPRPPPRGCAIAPG